MTGSSESLRFSPQLHKLLYMTVLVIVVAQQIYFPQALRYFHLALFFTFMVFNDMRAFSRRDMLLEGSFLGVITLTSVVSVIEGAAQVSLSWLYALFMIAAGTLAVLYFVDLFKIVKNGDKAQISEKHQMIFDKSTLFLRAILIAVIAIVVVADAYVISQII